MRLVGPIAPLRAHVTWVSLMRNEIKMFCLISSSLELSAPVDKETKVCRRFMSYYFFVFCFESKNFVHSCKLNPRTYVCWLMIIESSENSRTVKIVNSFFGKCDNIYLYSTCCVVRDEVNFYVRYFKFQGTRTVHHCIEKEVRYLCAV